jgi:hypothetical protein
MSAEIQTREAIRLVLEASATLRARVNQISDGDPAKASSPWLILGEGSASGFGALGVDGVALRVPVILTLRGDAPGDVDAVLDAVDVAMRTVPDMIGDWKVTVMRFERSRLRRDKAGWRIVSDYALRLVCAI